MMELFESRALNIPCLEGLVLFLLSLWKRVNEWVVWTVSWPFHVRMIHSRTHNDAHIRRHE
jgi:hypothetical protein